MIKNSQSKRTSSIVGNCRVNFINRELICCLFSVLLALSAVTNAAAQENPDNIIPVITNILLQEDTPVDDEIPVESNKVKIFILAGQSNMEGKGRIFTLQENIDKNGGLGTLEYLVTAPESVAQYGRLQLPSGEWLERDDVTLVNYSETNLRTLGPLTVTVTGSQTFGPELQFGQIVGDFYQQHVLIIKIAEGSRSLANDFRPPSSGGTTGQLYNVIIDRVNEVLGNLEQIVPNYNGQGYEILGFGWHQGYNDRGDLASNNEYQFNMVNFINDIREDLNVNEMPFVIANTGMGGLDETSPRALSLIAAQQAASSDPRLNHGDVYTVDTRPFWREEAVSPADASQDFHWHDNAETYLLIGNSLAEEILRMQ